MAFFESLLALLAVAIVLLQVSRRLKIPYPTMLAGAGVLLALIPGTPQIGLDPHMALCLFIAPVIVDAAYDFPVVAVRRLWRPLFALVVVAVLLSAGTVAWLGVSFAGLPLFAALALGAIVAPPDAAAATAVLSSVNMPRRSVTVLKGESLLNDATALLLFSTAIALQGRVTGSGEALALRLGLAAPGGILLGFLLAKGFRYVTPHLTGTRGGNLAEFVTCFGLWIIADRLGLSSVLSVVAFAMTIARTANMTTAPRMRIHSFAVWDATTFALNVFAFLLLGFQARAIVAGMTPDRLHQAAVFAGLVVVILTVVRLVWVLAYNRLAVSFKWLRGDVEPSNLRHSLLIGWSGMRGLVTLATAFSLPADFPQRDLIVLTAFAVVLATLVVQGLTLAPLVRLLKLDGDNGLDAELAEVRADLATTALSTLDGETGRTAEIMRYGYEAARDDGPTLAEKRRLGMRAVRKQRKRLEILRREERVGADAYLILQEELDFTEVTLTCEEDRRIEEN